MHSPVAVWCITRTPFLLITGRLSQCNETAGAQVDQETNLDYVLNLLQDGCIDFLQFQGMHGRLSRALLLW